MSEDVRVEEGMADEFTIGDTVYKVKIPKGKNGRAASGYVMQLFSDTQRTGLDIASIMRLLTDPEFENKHLASFIGVPQKVLDDEGSITEVLTALMATAGKLFETFSGGEGEAALKNSEEGQQKAQK